MRDRPAAAPTAGECEADGVEEEEEEAAARRGCYPNPAPRGPTPAAPTAGEGGSRWLCKRVVLEETSGKGAPAGGVQDAVPRCGLCRHPACRRLRPFGEGTSAAGAEAAVLTCGRSALVSTGLDHEGGVARCGFRITTLAPGSDPSCAQMGPAASYIPVASGGRGGGGGRGDRDAYIYGCTSRPQALKLAPTSDLAPKDKATAEMECMEEGYLAKIVQGYGAKEIKVGEVICVTMEEEGDIDKLKDYKPSAADAPAAPSESKATQEPVEPKVEEKVPAKANNEVNGPDGHILKADIEDYLDAPAAPSESKATPEPAGPKVEEKVPAKANNEVQLSSVKGNGPDGRILKADIEDYLDAPAAPSGSKATPEPAEPKVEEKVPAKANNVSLGGVNRNSTCRRTLINRVPSAVTGLNGSLSCGRVASASSFSSCADLPPHQNIGMPSLSPTMTEGNIASDINPISDREARSCHSRYEVLKERCCNLAEVPTLQSTCGSIKISGVDIVTQIFVDICGSTISLQKNLSKLDINMLTEAAFVRAGIKPSDFYSTFAGKVLEPNRLLSCYQIPRDSTIRLNARLRGGCAGDKTWDDIIRFQQHYVMVSLPPADLVLLHPDGSAQQGLVLVKYLAALMQFRSRKMLIQLCRKHYSGTSYGGNITSENILFDPDGNVRINSAPEKFTQHSAKLDYEAIGKILDDSFKDNVYPMHFYQLVDFLRYGPAVDCQSEAVIAFVTNHVSLLSHYVRVTISEILVQLIERIHPDVMTALLASLGRFVWRTTVKNVAAMRHTYYYHSRTYQGGKVWVPYVDNAVSFLKFSNNFFKHHDWASLEQLDAAFSLVMERRNFIPRCLLTILVTLKNTQNQCPALIQSFIDQVVEMLGNNVIDLERG